MKIVFLVIYAAGAFIYLDFAFWYRAKMREIWDEKKCKFRGILWKMWDRLNK